jgi:AcrR family transcriptional regulator
MNKGLETRISIVEESRKLFNRKGCDLTISQISREIGHGKSKLSNHFPKKSDLIFAILESYEKSLGQFIGAFSELDNRYTFQNHAALMNELFDLMFEYRGVIAYSLTAPKNDSAMMLAVRGRYASNQVRLRTRLEYMVESGLLVKEVLESHSLKTFEVQYMTSLTTWFITLELYYGEENYHLMKPEYIKAVLHTFSPYLTEKGRKELDATLSSIDDEKLKEHTA